jgi:hypothetical protein
MELLQLSDLLEDGKKILLTLETSLFKQQKILDHATVDHTQDSEDQLKSYQFLLVSPLFQLVNKLLSVIVLQV